MSWIQSPTTSRLRISRTEKPLVLSHCHLRLAWEARVSTRQWLSQTWRLRRRSSCPSISQMTASLVPPSPRIAPPPLRIRYPTELSPYPENRSIIRESLPLLPSSRILPWEDGNRSMNASHRCPTNRPLLMVATPVPKFTNRTDHLSFPRSLGRMVKHLFLLPPPTGENLGCRLPT